MVKSHVLDYMTHSGVSGQQTTERPLGAAVRQAKGLTGESGRRMGRRAGKQGALPARFISPSLWESGSAQHSHSSWARPVRRFCSGVQENTLIYTLQPCVSAGRTPEPGGNSLHIQVLSLLPIRSVASLTYLLSTTSPLPGNQPRSHSRKKNNSSLLKKK